ncbi:hypothetical protein ACP275_08G033900 [Erythranthe tilingii]
MDVPLRNVETFCCGFVCMKFFFNIQLKKKHFKFLIKRELRFSLADSDLEKNLYVVYEVSTIIGYFSYNVNLLGFFNFFINMIWGSESQCLSGKVLSILYC